MRRTWKTLGILGLYGMFTLITPKAVQAAPVEVETSTALYARIDGKEVNIREAADSKGQVIAQGEAGETFEVVGASKNGWLKVATSEGEGYIQDTRATVIEKTIQKVDETVVLRREVVEYAMQFLGNPYVWGGTDPNSGVDCSGFTRYVMLKAAGVSLAHNSTAQSKSGESISLEEIRPGDLIFYGGSGYINHVALYIGDGQVVHASTEETGIKISEATYRQPVKIVRILS